MTEPKRASAAQDQLAAVFVLGIVARDDSSASTSAETTPLGYKRPSTGPQSTSVAKRQKVQPEESQNNHQVDTSVVVVEKTSLFDKVCLPLLTTVKL